MRISLQRAFTGAATLALAAVLTGCSGTSSGNAVGAAAPAQRQDRMVAPHASQVTIVVMENKDYGRIAGSPEAPYINGILIPSGALLTDSHAVGHPSEPNYLALFSGSTHGVHGDPCPLTFSKANVASELTSAGKTFAGYSESMPKDGYVGCETAKYARKHSPWVNFTNLPSSENLVYRRFPASPPSLVWITPNLCNDMHDCKIVHGDSWLSKNLPPILAWDAQHDGLLIVTFDEAAPDADKTNHVLTVLVGPMIAAGTVDAQNVDHYAVLRTVESIFGLPCIKDECNAAPITGIWR